MRPDRRQTVVFDLDGTLVDSLPLVLAAIQHAIEPYGGVTSMDIFAHLGGPPQRFMADLLEDPAHVPDALDRMQRFHEAHFHLIQPYPEARALLEDLQSREVAAAIWTGRDRATTQILLRMHALEGLLAAVVCGDDLPTHKPDPAGLRRILSGLGSSADDTLYVGDADVDVLGGYACGVDTVLIRHQREIAREIAAKSWQVVGTTLEAYALIRRSVEL